MNPSPVVLADASLNVPRSGFADPTVVEAKKAAFAAGIVGDCRKNFRVEEISPIKAMLRSALQNAEAAEVEARGRGKKVVTTIFVASDLRAQEEVWRQTIKRPTKANLERLRQHSLVVPASVSVIEVCGVGETSDRLQSDAERDNVALAFRALVGERVGISMAGTCRRLEDKGGAR